MGLYTLGLTSVLLGLHLFRLSSSELFFWGWVGLLVMLCRRVGLRKLWWLDTLCWLVLALTLFFASFFLFEFLEPQGMKDIDPAFMVFLAPFLILVFGIPINGFLNRNKHLPQRLKPV